jgi:ATP-binding cassette, subfamily B, bacterial
VTATAMPPTTIADATADRWQGRVAQSQDDRLPIDEMLPRRREARALLGSLLRPFRLTLALLVLVVLMENAARLSVPLLVKRGIDHTIPSIMDGGPARELMLIIGMLCGLVLVHASSRLFFLNRSGQVRLTVLLNLRRRAFRHFQRLDIAFHDRYTTGRVVSRLTNDVEAIQDMLATGFDSLINALLTPAGTAILLVVLDWRLGLACLAAFPILVALAGWFRSKSSATYREVRDCTALVIAHFVETMTGIKAVQAYRGESRNQMIFEELADRYRAINEKAFKLVAVFTPGVRLVGNITVGVVLLYGGHRVLDGQITIGTLAAFLLYLRMFFDPMQEITQFFDTFQSASSALEKLAAVLAERPTIKDASLAQAPAPDSVDGMVVLDDVYFSYLPDRPVLAGLSLTIPAGQTVALVGPTGAGKSTIAKLIARFYDPTAGLVTLDGVDVRDLPLADLRRHVVMAPQETYVFSGTVADNIRFGCLDTTDEQVRDAAVMVGAGRFINALPKGFHTNIADRGVRLSAGQRQLIALARAFLADPTVLIVDEATSSLDAYSERMVQSALKTMLAKRTALIITHRLATVEAADRVLVLGEQGQIVEDGPPSVVQSLASLLAPKSTRQLWIGAKHRPGASSRSQPCCQQTDPCRNSVPHLARPGLLRGQLASASAPFFDAGSAPIGADRRAVSWGNDVALNIRVKTSQSCSAE